MFRFLLNILWVSLGGLVMALAWWLVALICAITIVGLPWARSCWVIGTFSLWPFGRQAVNRRDLIQTLVLDLWADWQCDLVSDRRLVACHRSPEQRPGLLRHDRGIPFGIQHLKLALIALAPVGMSIVDSADIRVSAATRDGD